MMTTTKAPACKAAKAGRIRNIARDMGRKPKEPDLTTFRGRVANRLRELRVRKYRHQDDFVNALSLRGVNITKATLSGWETGYRTPAIDLWPIIADALGVGVRALFPME